MFCNAICGVRQQTLCLQQPPPLGDLFRGFSCNKENWPFIAPDGYINRRETVDIRKLNRWIEKNPPRFEL